MGVLHVIHILLAESLEMKVNGKFGFFLGWRQAIVKV